MFYDYELSQLIVPGKKEKVSLLTNKIRLALNTPKTTYEAAAEVGCDTTTVRVYIRNEGLKRRGFWAGTTKKYKYCNEWR